MTDNKQLSVQPKDTPVKAERANPVNLAELDAAQLRDVIYSRLQGNTSIGPPVDPRVGKEPFEWLSEEFRRGSTSLQRRMTAVLEDFLDDLTDTDRWPERARYALLDLIQDCGEQLLDTIHRLIRQQTFLNAAGLGPDVHAGLLKVLISNGHHATPEFWLRQSQVLGPPYGALILSGLVDHGLDLAMRYLPQLSADGEARDYVRWLFPELQDRFGTAAVLEQLEFVRPQLPDATYKIYKNDLVPPGAADVTALASQVVGRWQERPATTTQYDIFISCSHRDSKLAFSLCDKLTAAGLRCFLSEKDVAVADRWEASIRDALRCAERILILITPNSKDSQWVVAEAGAAWALGKKLIPAIAYVSVNELITPIVAHQARRVHTPEEIDNLVRELSADGSIVNGDVTGQWRDPTDGDIVYFRQSNNRVLGYYNLGRGNQKLGEYTGHIENRVLDYHWRWLDGTHEGHGQMSLSPDGKRLSGEWWYGKKKDEVTHVGYRWISYEIPPWLTEEDFK